MMQAKMYAVMGMALALFVSATLCAAQDTPAEVEPDAINQAAPDTPVENAADAVAPAPAENDANVEELKVTVLAVRGFVRVREADDAPWQKAVPAMVLGPGAEFQTGPGSQVQFHIPPQQVITLDRLGTIKVLQAIRDQEHNKVTTDLGMKYGRTRCQVEAAGVEHDTTVYSPGNTLSIRGTDTVIGNEPGFPAFTQLIHGNINYKDGTGTNHNIKTEGEDENSPLTVEENSEGNADTQQPRTVILNPQIGQTPTESNILKDQTLFGSNFAQTFNLAGNLRTVSANQVRLRQLGDHMLGDRFPNRFLGALVFTLTWTSGDVDLDLSGLSPNGFKLATFPGSGGATTTLDGGFAGQDITSANGVEHITWAPRVPPGNYQIEANYFSGQTPANYELRATLTKPNQEAITLHESTGTLSPTQTKANINVQVHP